MCVRAHACVHFVLQDLRERNWKVKDEAAMAQKAAAAEVKTARTEMRVCEAGMVFTPRSP